MSEPLTIQKGMFLICREEANESLPERYKLWCVSSVRQRAKGCSVTLLRWTSSARVEATATFPGGIVQDPWQLFTLSERDLEHVYKARAE